MLESDLQLLQTRGLVRVTTERGSATIRFKHALTREATYNSMLQTRRAAFHRAAARTLTKLNSTPDPDQVLTIADHWQRGSDNSRALATLVPHTQTLINTGRILSLNAILTRLERDTLAVTEQRDLDIALADTCSARGEYEMARTLLDHALPAVDDDAVRARLLRSMGTAYDHLGDYPHALECHHAALELAQRIGSIPLQAQAAAGLGLAYTSLGDLERAEQCLTESRALSLSLGENYELANAEYNLAVLLFQRGKYAEAIASAERANALDEKFSHTYLAARSEQLLGACYHALGDLNRAETFYLRALVAAREMGDGLGQALLQSNLAELYADQVRPEEAEQAYRAAIEAFRRVKHESATAYNLMGLAQVQLARAVALPPGDDRDGELARADSNAQEALEIARRLQSPERLGTAHRVQAELALARGDAPTATTHITTALELLTQAGVQIELDRAIHVRERITP